MALLAFLPKAFIPDSIELLLVYQVVEKILVFKVSFLNYSDVKDLLHRTADQDDL